MPKFNTVVCYICNREFGIKSIDIHEPQCLAKWEIENNQLPKYQRRLKPLKPGLDNLRGDRSPSYDYEKYNQEALNSAQCQLLECKYCKRTFNPDRLPVHQKSCKEGKPLAVLKVSKKKSDNEKKKNFIERPGTATLINPQILDTSEHYKDMTSQRINKDIDLKSKKVSLNITNKLSETAITCHLCGDKVDGKFISEHESQCMEKVNSNNSKSSPSKKQPSPKKQMRGKSAQLIKRNSSPSKLSSGKENLSPCPHCSESFQPEKLESHLKNCGNYSKTLTISDDNKKKTFSCRKCCHKIDPKYNFCPNCGRPCSHKNCTHKETNASTVSSISQNQKSPSSSKSPSNSNQNSPSRKEASRLPSKPDSDKITSKTTTISRELPTVFCYICGRQFGTTSISIHEPQCLEKWKIQNEKLPKEQRRPVPQKPDCHGKTKEEINNIAYESAKQQLLPCTNCDRTFAPDRLPVHQKSCKPKNDESTTKSKTKGQTPVNNDSPSSKKVHSTVNKPRSIVCYICSREFGTKSIGIHEPQCLEKWKTENNKLPKELRKPMPQKPEGFSINNSADIEAYNEAANESSKQQLAACPNCSRTFNADRLSVHLKSCKPK